MANSHKISGSALIALKEALTNIYWIKNDLKMFVNHTINNKSFVSTLDMTKYKREIANDIVNRMSNRLDIYEEDLLLLLKAVSDMSDFSHLKKWEDADKKIKKAQESVEALRLHTKGYFAIIEEQKEAETRKITYQNKIQKAQFFQVDDGIPVPLVPDGSLVMLHSQGSVQSEFVAETLAGTCIDIPGLLAAAGLHIAQGIR